MITFMRSAVTESYRMSSTKVDLCASTSIWND